MAVRTFQTKLISLLVVILVLLQAATLIAVHVARQRTLTRSVADELRVGGRVIDRVIDSRGRQLSDTVRVLASDFAFREAIASGDQPTITSVLANHGSRIDADMVFLISPEGTVIAETAGGRFTGQPFPLPAVVAAARQNGEASAIVSFDNRPHQLVVVPVLAPRPIAWVCMGFTIDEAVLDDIHRLTALDVSLRSTSSDQKVLFISTLPQEKRAELMTLGRSITPQTSSGEVSMQLGNEQYETLLKPLRTADHSEIDLFLQRSLEEAGRPYRQLELQIFALSSLALVTALIAALFFARGVSLSLNRLAAGAEKIERGDYSQEVEVAQEDEIGTLATAFNKMRTAIAEREEQIRYQATHDALTTLPNRTLFLDRLRQSIVAAKRDGEIVGMLMMDLDRFKEINDTLGHHFGDLLLNEIGRRLSHALRESDSIARFGGDEFAVAFRPRDPSRVTDVAQRISKVLEAPFVLGEISIEVKASIGIALYPVHAGDADTLMKRADIAMYDAKKSHSPFAIYEAGRDEHSLRRLTILSELRHAISREELDLHYQPKIHIARGRALHAEALVRWQHPTHGRIAPDEFIPLAEQSGNISIITRYVLRKAIRDCAEWNASGLDVTVAINLSALDLYDAELPTFISGLLGEVSLPPSKLVLEITESAVMRDPAYAQRILSDLKRRGIALAIDDFGTGYSSLAHLKRLPVDELKIDKSFVMNLGDDSSRDDIVIVRSTIELGHNMGLKVIAEGVENAAAWQTLATLGCDMAQGYFVSRPLPANEFRDWMSESKWATGEAFADMERVTT